MATPTLTPSTITLLVVVPLIVWRIYSRIRRMVTRQRLSKVRPWITLVVFPLIVAMLALASLRHPANLAVLAGALAAGALLAVYGIRRTKFEVLPEGYFYTPNVHLGIALSLLLVARLVYRGVEIYMLNPSTPRDMQEFGRSPLTLAVFGSLAGYYVGYAIGLIRFRRAASAPGSLPAPD